MNTHCVEMNEGCCNADVQMNLILSSSSSIDWRALTKLVARITQHRRKHKIVLERLAARAQAHLFNTRLDAWRNMGRWVCRHGVFWLRAQGRHCPCMSETAHGNIWQNARWMCDIDCEIQALVAVPFDPTRYRHIATLRAECKRRNW